MPEADTNDYTAERIKHLDMVQAVVSRLSGNSAAMKRYCIVMVAVGVAIYKTLEEPDTVVALAAMVVVFWCLDARYLQQEKWFRDLHDEVRAESHGQRPDFRLTPGGLLRDGTSFAGRVWSWSTAGLYLPLLGLLILFWRTL